MPPPLAFHIRLPGLTTSGLFDPLEEILVLLLDIHRAVFGTMVEPASCNG